ncbi:hypothetical protein GCM10023322_21250 [Rugosimonospora acidiphila]|uniref:Glycosyltransferase 2-like domain-containing protein n=1 Tax=Rugosimonospora acidiphila TaxID=556531 RepID=A0ABP9RP24_9ACTN
MLSTAAQRLALIGETGARVVRPRPMRSRPLVSVVIPCYNYGRYLPGCVASVLGQPDVDIEVVIVDDASPDGSAETVRRLVAGDPRMRAIYHETNQGHITTYNDGLATVRGEYLVLLSADDLLVPGALGRATALMEAHPSVGLAYGATVDFTDTPPPARTEATTWTVWAGQDWLANRCRRGRNPLLSPEAVMRTSVYQKLGGYRADLPHAADLAMWLGAAMVSDVGYVGGADQAYYRVHAQSMSKSVNAGWVIDLQQRLRTFDVTLGEASRSAETAALLAAAHRALARQALGHAIDAWVSAAGRAATPDDAGRRGVESHRDSATPDDGTEALVENLVDVAMSADPDATRLPEWRVLRRIRGRSGGALRRSPSFRVRQSTRDLTDRVRWRRWRRAGV